MNQPEVLTPLPKGNFLTRVTASVRLGRGVVGNTTFGLWAACLLATALCITFVTSGYPGYALIALGMCIVFYLAYQGVTWFGVALSPDAGLTADEDYLGVVTTRQMGARDPSIVVSEIPQIGGARAGVARDE